MAHKYNARLYEKVTTLYEAMKSTIFSKFPEGSRQASLLEALKKEYIFLLFLVLKNELRGPTKGCAERITNMINKAKEQEKLGDIRLEVNEKANKLLYFIWNYPGKISVLMGRCAIGIFDRLL